MLEFASLARRDALQRHPRSEHDPITKEEAAGSHGARDGRLTLQEYVNALFIDFDKADTDKDGSLTFEEIEVYSRTTGR